MRITSLKDHIRFDAERFGRSVVFSSDTAVMFIYSFHPGQAMTEHTQPFAHVILHVLEGEAHVSVATETVMAPAGTVISIPPETVQAIYNRSDRPLVVASYMSPKP